MKSILHKILILINIPRILPLYFIYKILRKKNSEARKLDEDIYRWKEWKKIDSLVFYNLFVTYPEFRSIFYYRIGTLKYFVRWIYPPLNSLYINTRKIGSGLIIQHGFSTIIAAKSIGKNCWINQQVTIGYKGKESSVIGDNVRVSCGAKVIGGVRVGNNVIIGANAVVCKDVPDNCVVAGVPAKIIKRL